MTKFNLTVLSLIISTISLAQNIDIQGHRGARGKMPENTLPAFIYAMDQGVTTLELDVVITKDKKVLVSHEPWISNEICLNSDKEEIEAKKEKYNIYELTLEEVQQYDCGTKPHHRFKEQTKISTFKPSLEEVILQAEKHSKGVTEFEVFYNIEIKSTEKGDNVYHPEVPEFSELVYQVIDDYLPWERVTIQSFDFRVLQHWHKTYPKVRLAMLIENIKSPNKNIEELGFTPEIYSPYFKLLSENSVKEIHKLGMQVIPWTINEEDQMKKLVDWGVNGIITDYPDRARQMGLITYKGEE